MAFITDMLTMVDSTTANYTQAAYNAVASTHSLEIHLVLVAYIALFGWGVLTQKIEMTISAALRHVITMAIVVSLSTRWDIFAVWIYDVATNGTNKLIAAVSNNTLNPQAQLSNVFDQGMNAALQLFQAGGLRAWLPYLLGAGVYLATLLAVGYALFLLVLSKLALAVLLAIAPLFLLLLLFNATRNFFTSYTGQVINYALIPVFVYGLLALALAIIELALSQFNSASPTVGALSVSSYVVLTEVIVFVLLMQVKGMAASLGGGLQLSTMGAIGSAYQKLWGGQKAQSRRQQLGEALGRRAEAVKGYADRAMGRGKSLVGRRT